MGPHIIIKLIKNKNKPIKEHYICAKDPLIITLTLFIHENVIHFQQNYHFSEWDMFYPNSQESEIISVQRNILECNVMLSVRSNLIPLIA